MSLRVNTLLNEASLRDFENMSVQDEIAVSPPSNETFKEDEIKKFKEVIQDAQNPSISGLNYLGKSVFDVDGMAPLNKTSLVRSQHCFYELWY